MCARGELGILIYMIENIRKFVHKETPYGRILV